MAARSGQGSAVQPPREPEPGVSVPVDESTFDPTEGKSREQIENEMRGMREALHALEGKAAERAATERVRVGEEQSQATDGPRSEAASFDVPPASSSAAAAAAASDAGLSMSPDIAPQSA